MNIQGPKKPPTPVQAHAPQPIRGQHPFHAGQSLPPNFRADFDFNHQQQQHIASQQQPPQLFHPHQAGHPPQYPPPNQQQQQQAFHQAQQLHLHRQQIQQQQSQLFQQQQRQQQQQQQQQSQQQIRPLLSQPVSVAVSTYPGGVPHDMNQGVSVATASIPPTQPPISHTPPQSAVMYTQQPQRQTMMTPRQTVPPQQQQQQQQPQTQAPPQMGPPRQPGPGTPMNMNVSSPSIFQPQTTMFVQGQGPPYITGHSQVITLTGPMHGFQPGMPPQRIQQPGPFMPTAGGTPSYAMPNYSAAAAYHQQAAQAAPQMQPGMPPPQANVPGKEAIRQPTTPVYYGSAPTGASNMHAPSTTRMPMNVNALPYQKQKRKGLAIINPSTGQDISDEIYSNRSSSSATPPDPSQRATPGADSPSPSSTPQQTSQVAVAVQPDAPAAPAAAPPQPAADKPAEIQAIFAKQVAMAACGKSSSSSPSPAAAITTATTTTTSTSAMSTRSSPVTTTTMATAAVSSPSLPVKDPTPPPAKQQQQQQQPPVTAAVTQVPVSEPTTEAEEAAPVETAAPVKEKSPEQVPVKEAEESQSQEQEGQNRKKKGKHKGPRDLKEGSDMDAFVDSSPQSTASPSPTPGASAVENNIDAKDPKKEVATKEATPPPPTVDIQPPTPEITAPVSITAKPQINNQDAVPKAEAPPQRTSESQEDRLKSASPSPAQPSSTAVSSVQQPPPPAASQPTAKEPLATTATTAAATVAATAAATTTTNASTTATTKNITSSSKATNDVVAANNERNAAKTTAADSNVSSTTATSTSSSSSISVDKNSNASEIVNNKELKEQSNREEKEHQQQQQQNTTSTPPTETDSTSPSTPNNTADKIKQLRYQYKEDQWSPLNPEGKKLYDRSFLLTLQYSSESTVKPEGLTHLPDIILDSPHRRADDQGNRTGRDFTPGYIKPTSKPPAGGGGKRGSHQKPRGMGGISSDGPQRKIINIPQMEVKLHHTENAWKPTSKEKDEKDPDNQKTEALYKAVTGILNKLTPQKFQTLVQQVLTLEIDTEERLKGCIDRIFEKAVDEPNFSVAYANMCKCMTVLKVPSANNPNEQVLFRNLLLNRCQKEFERDRASEQDLERRMKEIEETSAEDVKKRLKEEMDVKQYNDKRRSLGNIRFIGELFKLKMLTEKIMHDCLVRLLKSEDEENYECLCRLMTTIGKDIDHPKSKQRVDAYFIQLEKISKNKKVSSRVRFMIRDLLELRQSKWTPRRVDNNPKTIEQIHREAQLEEQQKAALVARLQQEQKHIPQPQGRGRRQPPQQHTAPVGEDGWHSVGSGKANRIDPGKMKLTRHTVDDNIQLGPGGRPGAFGSWGRGSSGGGGKTSSQELDRSSNNSPANRFYALSASSENNDARSSRGMGRGLPPTRGDSRDGKRGSGMGPRRAGPRSSMEAERESALAAARTLSAPRGGPGSRNQSRESSRGRDDSRDTPRAKRVTPTPPPVMMDTAPVPAQAAPAGGKQLTEEEMERTTKSTMDEFLHIHDYKEAKMCVSELQPTSMLHLFVYHALNHVLEKSQQARQMLGNLLHDLVKENVITVDQYLQGLNEILEFAEDMEIDVPRIWSYLGETIGPMVQDGSVPLNFLRGACKPLRPQKAGQLLAEVLHNASQRLGHLVVGNQWRQSGLSWEEFLDPKQDLNEFIKRNKLEFTVGAEEPRSPVGKGLSREQVQKELDQILSNPRVENSDIIDWITANVGENNTKEHYFIRALMTSVCRHAITDQDGKNYQVEADRLKERKHLLLRYLDNNDELELQALYALQALVHKLEHPPGILRTIFDSLYDEDMISEDAFNQWDKSEDPAEMAGKGVARSSVEQFFTWLEEAEDDIND